MLIGCRSMRRSAINFEIYTLDLSTFGGVFYSACNGQPMATNSRSEKYNPRHHEREATMLTAPFIRIWSVSLTTGFRGIESQLNCVRFIIAGIVVCGTIRDALIKSFGVWLHVSRHLFIQILPPYIRSLSVLMTRLLDKIYNTACNATACIINPTGTSSKVVCLAQGQAYSAFSSSGFTVAFSFGLIAIAAVVTFF
ncbi:hypothetical protein PROFUN_17077 [Planoprotostelium fungivorum]|uniref:Uncharacterized protein n=1 Tax=Planoprotostelium fungivorum TaxID=1890364 RepID=A0A2P6MMR9_9EUKA|nr:hypothetical protein PROFUN_17077 [Planoprotostelium fungivorum]